jgi:integrase
MPKLTKRMLDASKARSVDYFLWCAGTPGFGVRIYPSGKKVFVAQVRVGPRHQTQRHKIGQFGPFTVEQARAQASTIVRAAAQGRDPRREKWEKASAFTINELCDRYLGAARAGLVITRFRQPKRSSTISIDEGRISRHIKPLIGRKVADELTRADVQRMVDDITEGKTAGIFKGKARGKAIVTGGAGTAARVVELLGGIFVWGSKRGLTINTNPARGVDKTRSQGNERVLSAKELATLGKLLAKQKKVSAAPVDALRLIALTGLRREEACGLRWSEVDEKASCLRLQQTKTGRSIRPIGSAALAVLRSVDRASETWVFPNSRDAAPAALKRSLVDLFDAAGLPDVRSQTLRRTFASIAADEGYSDATIGELLGHARRGVTARHYIRRPDAVLVAAANRVSSTISELLDGKAQEHNVIDLAAAR